MAVTKPNPSASTSQVPRDLFQANFEVNFTTIFQNLLNMVESVFLREDVSCEGRDGNAAEPAPNLKEGTEAAGDVGLLGHPRVTRAKLPRHGEPDEGCNQLFSINKLATNPIALMEL